MASHAAQRRSLRGKTVCIIGLGSIGRHLVEHLRPFGVTLVGTNHALENPPATAPPSSRANPLFEFAQALITPHIAGDTDLTATGTVAYLARMLDRWEAGIKPEAIVNAPAHPRRFP